MTPAPTDATALHTEAAALRQAGEDTLGLSPREMQIARLTTRGYIAREAALELGISHQTVSKVLGAIYLKLNITCAATLGYVLGVLDAGGPEAARAVCPAFTGGR